jgi:hypothetical protein
MTPNELFQAALQLSGTPWQVVRSDFRSPWRGDTAAYANPFWSPAHCIGLSVSLRTAASTKRQQIPRHGVGQRQLVFRYSSIRLLTYAELSARFGSEASQGAQRGIQNEVVACDLQRMSSHKRVICFQYRNGESLQQIRSKKDLAGSVCPFSLGRLAYLGLELPHRANMAFCLLKVKRRIAILRLRCFNIDIDQLTLSERVLTDQSNDT